ncbi:Cytochrome P450 [Sesbania bispinosa]|nr:Cytochrome P450 [Sesbania bispinosa]
MEHLFPFLLFSFSFILFLSQFLKVGKRFKVTAKAQNNLPPGPLKLPIIGSIHHLITTPPHHRLRELAQTYGPVMHLKLGEVSTIVVSSPEVAKEVLKTYDAIFAQWPHQVGADIMCYGSTDIATAPYGGYWKQLRRICSLQLLGPKRVRSFQSIREQEVSKWLHLISGTKPKLEELNRNFDITLENIIREVVTEKGSEGDCEGATRPGSVTN